LRDEKRFSLDYVPVQRTVTVTKVITGRWSPFLFAGGNSSGYVTVDGGAFVGKYGFGVEIGQNVFRSEWFIGGKVGVRF
jgi:hypothetical protein